MKPSRLIKISALCTAAALTLSACVVAPAPYPQVVGADGVVYANVPPPQPYAEVIPVAPFVGAIWISGYWNWRSGRHHWVPGRYERPVAGHRYVPHRWEQGRGGWHLRGGGWVR